VTATLGSRDDGLDVPVDPSIRDATRETPGQMVKRFTVRFLKSFFGAMLTLAIALIIWQLFLYVFDVSKFIGRGPGDVFKYLVTSPTAAANRQVLIDALWTTATDTALGFFAGTIAAVIVADIFVLRRGAEQAVMPLAMALRSVPLVAMTPLIALIFGRHTITVTMIAGIVTFFPTLVNVTLALRSVSPQSLDLMRAYGASDVTTLRKVQFPSALPALFASMRIAAPLAVTGALLAEWLATGKGLGSLMISSINTFETDRLWSAVVIVTLGSVFLYSVISGVESVVLTRYAPDQVKRVL